ncbi:MAG: SH3 domain-containing protein [Clostridiales bacterium]|jgi:hypothetical protein|nr:SH3 domain-containing protein [Clostridiales bacterium]
MRRHERLRLFTFILAALLVFGCFAPGAMALEAMVIKKANMRAGADKSFESLDEIKKGQTVTVLDNTTEADWWKVAYDGKEGYMAKANLELLEPETKLGYVTRNTTMRAGMGVQHASIMPIPINASVGIVDDADKTWWKIFYENTEGYVQAAALRPGELTTTSTNVDKSKTNYTVGANDVNADKIAKAKGINKDTVGWVNIPNTNIDDPVLYAANFYYNAYNIYKKKSLEGVYPYANRLTRNVVIFGHNLRGSNSGFHQLHHLQEAAQGKSTCQYGSCGKSVSHLSGWHKNVSHRTWNISIFGKSRWEVFAMYEVPKNEPIASLRANWNTSPAVMGDWIQKQIKRSEIDFGVSVSDKDQIMTIITCGTYYDSATANSRLFVFLKNVG